MTSFTPELKLTNSIGGYTIDHANNNAIHVTKVPKKDARVISKKHSLTPCKEFSSVEVCNRFIFDSLAKLVTNVKTVLLPLRPIFLEIIHIMSRDVTS